MVQVGDVAEYVAKKNAPPVRVVVDSMTACRVRVVERLGDTFRRFVVKREKLVRIEGGLLGSGDALDLN